MPVFSYDDDRTFYSQAYSLAPGDTLFITQNARMIGNLDQSAGMYTRSPLITAFDATIHNDGIVTASNNAIWLYSGSTLQNTGTISTGDGTGYASTIITTLDLTIGRGGVSYIYNSGRISNNGTGPYSSVFRLSNQTLLINDGVISALGTSSAVLGDNYLAHSIMNYGTINGDIHLYDGSETFSDGRPAGAGGDTVLNSGHISGNVILGVGRDMLQNGHGSIDGSVSLGTNNDSLDNVYGMINGSVDLGDGDDRLDNTNGVITGTIVGGSGNDTIIGGAGRDVIYGDNVSGDTSAGNDTIYGGYGDDLVYGGFGDDGILGNQGDDILYGNQGNDTIHGGQGDDVIYGGQGGDIVNGGLGNDTLFGNLGDDRFVFSMGFGHDTVADLSAVPGNNDVIQFQPGTFASYTDLQSHMVQQGSNVVITLNDHDSVLLLNTNTAALTADHFIFG